MRSTDAARTQSVRPLRASRLVRRGLVPAAVVAGSLGASTAAGASAPQSVVTTAKVSGLGTVLVASHRPLYEKASEPKGHTTCTGACTKFWKPLIVSGKQVHHLGHFSGLGTIHRSNGQLQVAVHGHALYWYAGDHSQSQANAQGFANTWFTVKSNGTLNRTNSSGTIVTVPPTSTPGQPASPTTTRPTSAPASPAPTGPAPTSPPPTAPPTTSPPPPPPTTTVPPTTTTTTSGGGGGVGF